MNARRNQMIWAAYVALGLTMLNGCKLAGDIFKAGFWTAILAVVLVVGLIAGGFALLRR